MMVKKKNSAQGMVEFALVLPVLLMVILGLIEFGRLMFIYSAVTSASREASRYGASIGPGPNGDPRYRECEAIRSQAMRLGELVGVGPGDIYINYDSGPEGTPPPGTPTPQPSCPQEVALGDRVIVEVRGWYNPLPAAPLVGLLNFEFRSISRRTIIKDASIQQAGTAIGDLPTDTPTITTTPDGTLTPTLSPTPTDTPDGSLPSPSPTNTPTPTPVPPQAPLFVSVNWTPSGQKCNDIILTWEPNPGWVSYPGSSPIKYQVLKNGFEYPSVPPGDPGQTSWLTGDQLNDNSEISYDVFAIFSGPLRSLVMTKTYLCQNGSLVDISPSPQVNIEIVIPGVDGIVITDQLQTAFEAHAWDTSVGLNNGDGIQVVYFEVTGPGGIILVITDEFFVQYCVFSGNGPCGLWNDNASISFDSAPEGTYTIRARALSNDGVFSAWETRTFILDRPDPTDSPTATPTETSVPPSPTPTETIAPPTPTP